MKKSVILATMFLFLASFAFAQTPAATMTIKGTIIDNQCAGAQKPEGLAEFIKTHKKDCTLMPGCVTSGYSIYSNGKLTKFDNASSAKIVEFLKQPANDLKVVVVVKTEGNLLSLVSIENQK